jgi:hypothetical protein
MTMASTSRIASWRPTKAPVDEFYKCAKQTLGCAWRGHARRHHGEVAFGSRLVARMSIDARRRTQMPSVTTDLHGDRRDGHVHGLGRAGHLACPAFPPRALAPMEVGPAASLVPNASPGSHESKAEKWRPPSSRASVALSRRNALAEKENADGQIYRAGRARDYRDLIDRNIAFVNGCPVGPFEAGSSNSCTAAIRSLS